MPALSQSLIRSRRILRVFAVLFTISGLGALMAACDGDFTAPPAMRPSPPASQLAPAAGWLVVDLGTVGGAYSAAWSINEDGQIVGTSSTAGGEAHPFLWESGQMTDLGNLSGYATCEARSINDVGRVVGSCTAETAGPHAPFLWEDGVLSPLTLPAGFTGFEPHAINNNGQIVGYATTATGEGAYVWDNGALTEVVPPEGFVLYFLDINSHGTVSATYAASSGLRAFLWDAGQTTLIDPASGGTNNEATNLNDVGQAVGLSWNTTDFINHGYIWEDGLTTAFTSPGDVIHTQPEGLNNNGMATGLLFSPTTGFRAFVWEAGQMVVLDGLSGTYGWAHDLNDAGQVVGVGHSSANQNRATLWVQTQEFVLVFEQATSALVVGGTLTGGQAQSLVAKVDRALQLHQQGRTRPALALVGALMAELESLLAEGVLTQPEADALLALAATLQSALEEVG